MKTNRFNLHNYSLSGYSGLGPKPSGSQSNSLLDGLIAYFPMHEVNGSRFDALGNYELLESVSMGSDLLNGSLAAKATPAATSLYITDGTPFSSDAYDVLTICFWAQLLDVGANAFLLGHSSDWIVGLFDPDLLLALAQWSAGETAAIHADSVTSVSFNRICINNTAGTLSVSMNNGTWASVAVGPTSPSSSQLTALISATNILMNKLGFWNRELTEDEWATLYSGAEYPFN